MTDQTIRTSHGCELDRRIWYEPSPDEPLSIAAATALARFRDEQVTAASTRLYEYVDPEALDALFADTCDGASRSTGTVEFEADGLVMTIAPDCIEVTSSS